MIDVEQQVETEEMDLDELIELHTRSFIDWSQSANGFYVKKRPDPSRRRKWIYGKGPIVWQPHQITIGRHLFTLNDRGKLPYSTVWWIDVGQSGKSLMQAAVAQWCGQFHEQDAEVQLAANSEKQTEMRVWLALKRSLELNPDYLEIADVNKERIIFYDTGNIVRSFPVNAGTISGGTAVFRGLDEPWAAESDEAKTFFDEFKESPASWVSLLLATSYPPFEDSEGPMNKVLSKYFNDDDTPMMDVLKQPFPDLPLYTDDKASVAIYWNHDAFRYPWIDEEFLDKKRNEPGTSESGYTRIWLAKRASREETFMPLDKWDACKDDSWAGLTDVDRDIPMVIGLDAMGGKEHSDCASATARGYEPTTMRLPLYEHKIWDPRKIADPDFDYIQALENWVIDKHNRHNVIAVYADPTEFTGSIARLKERGIRIFEFTQVNNRTAADTHYRNQIKNKRLRNYEHCEDLRQHIANAIATVQPNGTIRLNKQKSTRRIDGAVSDSMCTYGVLLNVNEFINLAQGSKVVMPPIVRNRYKNIYWRGHAQNNHR
jgi:phage terminase large subunit-like protein